MSYIRSLSNPEGLYIISCKSKKGTIEIFHGQTEFKIPKKVFYTLFLKYCNDRSEDVKYRGGILTVGPQIKLFLHYKNWPRSIEMWEVTALHIANSIKEHIKNE